MISERPFADGRRCAVLVFNALRTDGGRLTQLWLARLRALDAAGWATHAALINKNAQLDASVRTLVKRRELPAATVVHHYAMRDRRVRPAWWAPLPADGSIDARVGDWLDWLTGQIPGAVVMADSPAAYPYLACMTNPLVARVAGIHLNHLAEPASAGSGTAAQGSAAALGPLADRFDDRFAAVRAQFDAVVVMTGAQSADLRARFGPDLPVVVIPPGVARPDPAVPTAPTSPATASASGSRRLVSVGPATPSSGHADAIRALAAVAPSHDVSLDVVGAGDDTGLLADLAAGLGVADRVRLQPPGVDLDALLAGAQLTVWAGGPESYPAGIVRSLAHGVPVLARDLRYGPAELITSELLGAVVPREADLAAALAEQLQHSRDPQEVLKAAQPLLRSTDPDAVGAAWVRLATRLADAACDHRAPSLLVESVSTTTRVLRLPGVLADAGSPLASWTCRLPGLMDPAGWLSEPPLPLGVEAVDDDDELPVHPHAAGPTREVVVQLRSNALAFVATETGRPFRVELSDGAAEAPLRCTQFSDRIIASRTGNATLRRRADGTVWVDPRPELLLAQDVDGRLLVRAAPEEPPSDVTHAIDWVVDVDWADLTPTPAGAAFRGTLRATGIAPAEGSAPALCVTDVGGFSRVVGALHYTADPVVEGLTWTAGVDGVLEVDPLIRTTELARRALPLHVGYRGLLVPVGGLWTHGHRSPIHLASARGEVTLLPSPGGRVLAAPGKGYRARASGAVRALVRRG